MKQLPVRFVVAATGVALVGLASAQKFDVLQAVVRGPRGFVVGVVGILLFTTGLWGHRQVRDRVKAGWGMLLILSSFLLGMVPSFLPDYSKGSLQSAFAAVSTLAGIVMALSGGFLLGRNAKLSGGWPTRHCGAAGIVAGVLLSLLAFLWAYIYTPWAWGGHDNEVYAFGYLISVGLWSAGSFLTGLRKPATDPGGHV